MKKQLVILSALLLGLNACHKLEEINANVVDFVNNPPQQHGDRLNLTFHKKWVERIGQSDSHGNAALQPSAADNVIVSSDSKGHVRARRLDNGKLIWASDIGKNVSSGPTVADGVAVVGTHHGATIALNLSNGKQLWASQLSSEILAAPTITDDAVYVKSFDDCLYKLNRADGKQLWSYCHDPVKFKLRASSGISVANGLAITGFSDGKIAAFDEHNGSRRWITRVAYPSGDTHIQRLVDIDSTPVVIDGIVYVVSYQGSLAAVGLDTGQILWNKKMGAYRGLAFTHDTIFVSDNKSVLWALGVENGNIKWKQTNLAKRHITAPVVFNNKLLIADAGGYLMALSQSDGSLIAQALIDRSGIASAAHVYNDNIYVQSQGGVLASLSLQDDI